jgi:hypothetical protein
MTGGGVHCDERRNCAPASHQLQAGKLGRGRAVRRNAPFGAVPTDDLEAIFHEELKRFFFSPEEIAEHLMAADTVMEEKRVLLEALEQKHGKVRSEIDKLYYLYQSAHIDKDGFGRKYTPLKARMDQLGHELPARQAELDVLRIGKLSQEEVIEGARDLYTRRPTLPKEEKRQIVGGLPEGARSLDEKGCQAGWSGSGLLEQLGEDGHDPDEARTGAVARGTQGEYGMSFGTSIDRGAFFDGLSKSRSP